MTRRQRQLSQDRARTRPRDGDLFLVMTVEEALDLQRRWPIDRFGPVLRRIRADHGPAAVVYVGTGGVFAEEDERG